MPRVIWVVLILVVILGGVYYVGSRGLVKLPIAMSSNSPDVTSSPSDTVNYSPSGFFPSVLTVKPGTRVTFTNNNGGQLSVNSDPHPIHTDYPPLNLGTIDDGQSKSLVFDQAGTYKYHNHLNPGLRGTIVVQ
jgi:plastocyanin